MEELINSLLNDDNGISETSYNALKSVAEALDKISDKQDDGGPTFLSMCEAAEKMEDRYAFTNESELVS